MLRLLTQPSSFAGAAAILTAFSNASQNGVPHDAPSWLVYVSTLLCGAAAILRDGAAPAGASVPPAR